MTGRRMLHFYLSGLPGPIAVDRRLEVIVGDLRRILVGWPELPADRHAEPFLSVTGRPDRVIVERRDTGERRFEPTTTSAICTIIVELMAAFVEGAPKLGNLHAAAVEIGKRLVVFPATNRAGKSTLVAAFAASGYRVFADDLLPVDLESLEGMASGCLPRVRLPLPERSPPVLLRHAVENTVVGDGYYAYLSSGRNDVSHGTRAPIGAIVLPELDERRRDATLSPVEAEEALLRVLLQDTKYDYSADWTLTRYLALAENAHVLRLSYGDIGAAIDCLVATFSEWSRPKPPARRIEAAPFRGVKERRSFSRASTGQGPLYRRAEKLEARVVGNSAFLIDLETDNIHHLNTLGLGLWNLLEQPSDARGLAEIVAGAFPETPRAVIEADIDVVLSGFAEAGLVETTIPPAAEEGGEPRSR